MALQVIIKFLLSPVDNALISERQNGAQKRCRHLHPQVVQWFSNRTCLFRQSSKANLNRNGKCS